MESLNRVCATGSPTSSSPIRRSKALQTTTVPLDILLSFFAGPSAAGDAAKRRRHSGLLASVSRSQVRVLTLPPLGLEATERFRHWESEAVLRPSPKRPR